MALHWSGVGAAPLMSPRQDETSEPLLYAGLMAGPYRCKDATRGRNDDLVTSGIRARLDRGGPKQNRSSCSPKKFLKVLAAQWWSNGLIQMVDDNRCTLDLKSPERDIRTGRIIGRGTEREGLYYVDEVTTSGTVMLAHRTSEKEAWLWHRRL
nr:putative ribonuclease H-like domain-containing protein [Tanacetum cinerariifolium]